MAEIIIDWNSNSILCEDKLNSSLSGGAIEGGFGFPDLLDIIDITRILVPNCGDMVKSFYSEVCTPKYFDCVDSAEAKDQCRKCKAVNILCGRCSLEVVTQYFDDKLRGDVMRPTLVALEYRRSLSNTDTNSTNKEGTISPFCPLPLTRDIQDGVKGTIPMMITDRNHHKCHLYLGADIVTLADNQGTLRHFIESINPGSPAAKMFFREDDELLLLNGDILVGISSDKVKQLLLKVHTDDEFWMFTRRLNPACISGSNTYSYWMITATVTCTSPVGISFALTTKAQARLYHADFVVVGDKPKRESLDINAVGNRCVLWNKDGTLALRPPPFPDDDPAFVFEKITYKVVETFATGDSHELSLLRQSIDGSSSSTDFICISPDDEVILKAKAQDVDWVPTNTQVEESNYIQRALFLIKRVETANSDPKTKSYFLEPYCKRGFYVSLTEEENLLSLVDIRDIDEEELIRNNNLHFGLHPRATEIS